MPDQSGHPPNTYVGPFDIERHIRELAEENFDRAERVVADGLSDAIKAAWMRVDRVQESRVWYPCWKHLFDRHVSEFEALPGEDHISLWKQDGRPKYFVSQPYHLELETVREMVTAADQKGLEFIIRGFPSWYFPGQSFSVFWSKAEQQSRL